MTVFQVVPGSWFPRGGCAVRGRGQDALVRSPGGLRRPGTHQVGDTRIFNGWLLHGYHGNIERDNTTSIASVVSTYTQAQTLLRIRGNWLGSRETGLEYRLTQMNL